MAEVKWSDVVTSHGHALRRISRAAVERLRDPSLWACDATGSTDSVWMRLDDGLVASPSHMLTASSSEATSSSGTSAAAAWLSLGSCSAQELIATLTNASTALASSVSPKGGDVVVILSSSDGKLLSAVPQSSLARFRGISRLMARVQQALSVNYEREYGSRSKSGWALLRSAVKLIGLATFSDQARQARARLDLKEAAMRRMLHFDQWRAWQKLSREIPATHRASCIAEPIAGTKATNLPPLSIGVGLRNLGNTCYMNSVLQMLLSAEPLRDFVWQEALRLAHCDTSTAPPALEALHGLPQFGYFGRPWAPGMRPPLRAGYASTKRLKPSLPSSGGTAEPSAAQLVIELGSLFGRASGSLPLSETTPPAVITPESFLQVMWAVMPRFSGFQQRDADEFCRELLAKVEEAAADCSAASSASSSSAACSSAAAGTKALVGRSRLWEVVGGETMNLIRCSKCGASRGSSGSAQSFVGPLSVDIPRGSGGRGSSGTIGSVRLLDCLNHTFSPGKLESEAVCSSCGAAGEWEMTLRMVTCPRVLLLHVNRVDWSTGGPKKIRDKLVLAKLTLDLSPWVIARTTTMDSSSATGEAGRKLGASSSPSAQFHLVSLVEHHGRAAGTGHYTSIGKSGSAAGDGWRVFNDHRVTLLRQDDSLPQTNDASMLCFVRDDFALA